MCGGYVAVWVGGDEKGCAHCLPYSFGKIGTISCCWCSEGLGLGVRWEDWGPEQPALCCLDRKNAIGGCVDFVGLGESG